MQAWLSRPISNSTAGISATYGGTSVLANVAAFGIANTYDLPTGALYSTLACLAVALLALAVLETIWMLDLEDEKTG